jgi:hypothetical protein
MTTAFGRTFTFVEERLIITSQFEYRLRFYRSCGSILLMPEGFVRGGETIT